MVIAARDAVKFSMSLSLELVWLNQIKKSKQRSVIKFNGRLRKVKKNNNNKKKNKVSASGSVSKPLFILTNVEI